MLGLRAGNVWAVVADGGKDTGAVAMLDTALADATEMPECETVRSEAPSPLPLMPSRDGLGCAVGDGLEDVSGPFRR